MDDQFNINDKIDMKNAIVVMFMVLGLEPPTCEDFDQFLNEVNQIILSNQNLTSSLKRKRND